MNAPGELAAAAARLVIEEGLEYAAAKRKAARDFHRRGGSARAELPSNEEVEDAVREQLELFHADTQPAELGALREVAVAWMRRLAAFRPHLAGAVWRGTATRQSAVHLDLYCDDAKEAEIALINAGIDYDAAGGNGDALPVLSVASHSAALGDVVTVHLAIRDHDELRGALKPDARGRSWRGDLAALERRLADVDTGATGA